MCQESLLPPSLLHPFPFAMALVVLWPRCVGKAKRLTFHLSLAGHSPPHSRLTSDKTFANKTYTPPVRACVLLNRKQQLVVGCGSHEATNYLTRVFTLKDPFFFCSQRKQRVEQRAERISHPSRLTTVEDATLPLMCASCDVWVCTTSKKRVALY